MPVALNFHDQMCLAAKTIKKDSKLAAHQTSYDLLAGRAQSSNLKKKATVTSMRGYLLSNHMVQMNFFGRTIGSNASSSAFLWQGPHLLTLSQSILMIHDSFRQSGWKTISLALKRRRVRPSKRNLIPTSRYFDVLVEYYILG